MKIEHIALFVSDLEGMRQFYETHFDATAGERYHNPTKGFTSYFLTFSSGARLELMQRTDITELTMNALGYAHLAPFRSVHHAPLGTNGFTRQLS